ncbi:MAG: prenyltransferase/squalene oxidase repeat-containing protein [Methanolinea sp.]|nr:prenyltransferase/squalene oxidase repeat-containing protein [Methanolinea sp.]
MTQQGGGPVPAGGLDIPAGTVEYARSRRCPSGGYCFYRLDEPNAGDTCFALGILSLMGQRDADEKTVRFLQDLQYPDGSYASLSCALFAGWALRMLRAEPLHDPSEYILRSLPRPDPRTKVVDSLSLFEPLRAWTALADLYGVELPTGSREEVTATVLSFRSETGGFGAPGPTLQDTRMAAEILASLGHGCDDPATVSFVDACGDPEFGFLGRPGSKPAFLEQVHAGLRLSFLLGEAPRHAGACRDFVRRCAHPSGGFARSVFGGSPTLEYTARAVESLAILAGFSRGRRDYSFPAPYM